MRLRNLVCGLLITSTMLTMLFAVPNHVDAKSKDYKPITINKGERYNILSFLKVFQRYEKAETLRKKLKKNKFKLSGKAIKVKGKFFKAKKEGNLTLKVKVKKKTYKIPVCSVTKYKLQANNISKIEMKKTGPFKTLEVTDASTIKAILNQINGVKYKYTLPKKFSKKVGYTGYHLDVYDLGGKQIKNGLCIMKEKLVDNLFFWDANSALAKGCYDYLEGLYKPEDKLLEGYSKSFLQ